MMGGPLPIPGGDGGGMPMPPQVPPGPMPGSPIAGGPPVGLPMAPGAGNMAPGPMSPGEEDMLMAMMAEQSGAGMPPELAGMGGPPAPPPPEMVAGQDAGGGERYDIEEQEDGSLLIYENMPEGGRVAKKIVTMGNKAASASANV